MSRTILLLILGAIVALSTRLNAASFEEANRLMDEGQFAQAKAAYESVRQGGAVTANLLYNLGNAEFRLKSPGQAAVQYERALSLEPGHPEARTNLEFIRRQTGARLLEPTAVQRVMLPWSLSTYTVLAAVAAWVFIFAVVAIFFWGLRESLAVWFIAVFSLLVGVYGAFGFWSGQRARALAVVVDTSAIARVRPADRTAEVENLPAGSQVRILSMRDAWIYCELPGKGRGWLPQASLQRLWPEELS